ncbi:MAG: serine/threonine-protein kinase [Candidatus Acidiferrales bacterium]
MSALSPNQWQEVSPYLDQALALSDEERGTWLKSVRADKPALAGLLEELLEEHRALAAEHFLEGSPPTPLNQPSLAGQNVGAYTLVAQIGQGGMGSVWLAQRSDGRFDRRVAIKLVNFAVAAEGGAERFQREGRILARIAHPHIAELIDAGVMPTGQAYLVLEYVEGKAIDEYCDEQKLDIDSRTKLFLDVLDAVAHAHANLVVHRDIKPSNVMVSSDGEAKLLDFGIAKLLDRGGNAAGATVVTLENGGGLTPQFAAPEQMTGGAITTATDVYSLGVLLYLILTGGHPVGPGPHSPADLVKAITETEPPRASDAIATRDANNEATARATTRDKLRRQLRGDLDTILGKALKKDPQARYPSAAAMADDLRRYLAHEPIRARPDTLAYVGAKFLRRYWLAVSAVTVVVASLSAGVYVANRERAIAEQRFAQLRQLSSQMFDLDTAIRRLPGSTDAREHLVSIAAGYLDGLAANAHGNLDLTEEVAEGYLRVARVQGVPTDLNLGEPAKAEASLKEADELIDRVLAARPHKRSALLLSAQITNARMILATEEHRNQDALAYARKSAERLDAFMGLGNAASSEKNVAAGLYSNIAMVHLNMHLYSEAVPYARRLVELGRSIPSDLRLVDGLTSLCEAECYQGHFKSALQDMQQARTVTERMVYSGPAGRILDQFGTLLHEGLLLGEYGAINLGRPNQAVGLIQRAFDIAEHAAEKDPRDALSRERVVNAGIPLGNLLRDANPQKALAIYDLALKRDKEAGNSVIMLRKRALLLANSSYALLSLHRSLEAKRRIDESLAILRETKDYPTEQVRLDSEAYVVESASADYEAKTGEREQATRVYEQLFAQVMAAHPAADTDLRDAPPMSRLCQRLAELYRSTGNTSAAQKMESHRMKLWQGWDQKLPGNTFVRRELAAGAARTT